MRKPFIVVVTGPPGSGKTTLAHALAQRIRCPALCRDEFKEGFVHTTGSNHAALSRNVNRRVYEIFFSVVDFVVSREISIVIEAAFQHHVWQPKLQELGTLADISIIVCTVNPRLARARFAQRALSDPARERFHGDQVEDERNLHIDDYQPPDMEVPTLTVETTDGYRPGLDKIAAFVMEHQQVSQNQ